MPHLFYLPDEKTVEAQDAETILEVSLRSQIPHMHACGGHARCSTCRVLVLEGLDHCPPRNDPEQAMAERLGFDVPVRLACQTRLLGDVKLRRLVLDADDTALVAEAQQQDEPRYAGVEKRVAVLFADIRGFTTFAETLPAYDVVHLLNRYFYQMGKVIEGLGGCVNNYMGDGLMALFGVDDGARPAWRAVKAGLDMLDQMQRLKAYLLTAYFKSFEIGIGIHYGDVVIGTIGVGTGKRVTAIGDVVNVASRIEAANKLTGTKLLISEDVYKEVEGQVKVRQTATVPLAGRSGQHTVYEVTGIE
jgi:adenylate cyclase